MLEDSSKVDAPLECFWNVLKGALFGATDKTCGWIIGRWNDINKRVSEMRKF